MKSPIKEMKDNQLWLIHLPETIYALEMKALVKYFEKSSEKIGYICFNKLYSDVKQEFDEEGIDINKFCFVDVLSSHYESPEKSDHCIFVKEPTDIEGIKNAINMIIKQKGCKILLFDTISKLLVYQQKYQIIKFTHELNTVHSQVKKLFISLKEEGVIGEEGNKLLNDLSMFADKTILLNKIK